MMLIVVVFSALICVFNNLINEMKGNKDLGATGSYPFPPCLYKKQGRMVCLNNGCQEYPFFCANCDNPSCQTPHTHDDKLSSISYKQFTKRVLRERKPIEKLSDSMQSYKQTLQKLREDVNLFIEKQMAQLQQITQKAEYVAPDDDEIIVKLKEQKYEGLCGKIMDKVWSNCAEDKQQIQAQEQTADFIKIKEEEVKGISEHFQHLNQMDHENVQEANHQ